MVTQLCLGKLNTNKRIQFILIWFIAPRKHVQTPVRQDKYWKKLNIKLHSAHPLREARRLLIFSPVPFTGCGAGVPSSSLLQRRSACPSCCSEGCWAAAWTLIIPLIHKHHGYSSMVTMVRVRIRVIITVAIYQSSNNREALRGVPASHLQLSATSRPP